MPTPALYTGAQAMTLFTALPPDLRSPSIELFYITDRAPAAKPDDAVPYTAGRSRSTGPASASDPNANSMKLGQPPDR